MKKKFTVPLYIYLVLLVLGLVLPCIPKLCKLISESEWLSDCLENIGYGVIASTIASLVIDFGNTIRKKQNEQKVLDRMLSNLKEICEGLPVEVHTAVCDLYSDKITEKRTLAGWLEKLFDENIEEAKREEQQKQIEFIIDQIKTIGLEASNVKKAGVSLPDSDIFNETYLEQLENLKKHCFLCRRVPSKCKEIILTKIVPLIIELFPDVELYEVPFDETDYM